MTASSPIPTAAIITNHVSNMTSGNFGTPFSNLATEMFEGQEIFFDPDGRAAKDLTESHIMLGSSLKI